MPTKISEVRITMDLLLKSVFSSKLYYFKKNHPNDINNASSKQDKVKEKLGLKTSIDFLVLWQF